MKKLLYALLAAGIVFSSCGFVVAEKPIEAQKSTYPAKIEITQPGNLTGKVKSGDEAKKAIRAKIISPAAKSKQIPATKLKPAEAVK